MSGGNWNTNAGDTEAAMADGTVAGYFSRGEDASRAIHELADEGFDPTQVGAAFHSSAMAGSSKPFYERAVNDLPIHSPGGPDKSDGGPQSDTHAVSPWGLTTWGAGTPFMARPPSRLPFRAPKFPQGCPARFPANSLRISTAAAAAHEYAYSGSAFENSFSGMGIPPDHARRLSRELRRGGAVVTVNAGPRTREVEEIMERNHGVIRYESAPAGDEPARA